MPKQCKHPGCYFPVFSNGYCQRHQNDRTDEKWLRAKQKKEYDKNKWMKGQKQLKDSGKKPTGEKEMFDEIWNERPRVSHVSGESLQRWEDTKLFVNLFSHILPKGNYSRYRLNKENIILLTPQQHLNWHSYTRDKLLTMDAGWRKVFDLYDKLKEEYNAET